MLSKPSANGTAGFVLANGLMSSNTSGEGEIRAQMIENDLIDCILFCPASCSSPPRSRCACGL